MSVKTQTKPTHPTETSQEPKEAHNPQPAENKTEPKEVKAPALGLAGREAHEPESAFVSYWGVDSARPANSYVGSQLLYDQVVKTYGKKPQFWGRYIGGYYAIDKTELAYLHSKGVSVLFIYNGASETEVSYGYQTGVKHANFIINALQLLSLPPNILVGIDNESGWNINPDFIGGLYDTMKDSQYKHVFIYANAQSDNNFLSAYATAWNRYPSLSKTAPLSMIYTSEPEWVPGNEPTNPVWNPSYPPENALGTTMWQYVENVDSQMVDLDMCSQAAFSLMYHPVISYRITKTCALKPQPPNHESASIHTLFGGTVVTFISEGTFTDPVTHKTEEWLQITAPKSSGNITGWVPKANTEMLPIQ